MEEEAIACPPSYVNIGRRLIILYLFLLNLKEKFSYCGMTLFGKRRRKRKRRGRMSRYSFETAQPRNAGKISKNG